MKEKFRRPDELQKKLEEQPKNLSKGLENRNKINKDKCVSNWRTKKDNLSS